MTTTTRITLPVGWLRLFVADHALELLALAALLCTFAGALLVRIAPVAASQPEIVQIIATPTPPLAVINAAPEFAIASVPTLPRTVAAFAAPAGAYLGTVPEGATYITEARTPDGWVLLRVANVGGFDGFGAVWVAAQDAPAGAEQAPMLAPTPVPPLPAPVPAAPVAPAAAPLPPAPAGATYRAAVVETGACQADAQGRVKCGKSTAPRP